MASILGCILSSLRARAVIFPYGRPAGMTPRTHRAAVEDRLRRTIPQHNVRLPPHLQGDQLDAALNAVELFHLGHHGYLRQSRADVWQADTAITKEYLAGLRQSFVLLGVGIKGVGAVLWAAVCAGGRWVVSIFR